MSQPPSDEIVRLNNDGKPDLLERWWNGKRVRRLDKNGDGITKTATVFYDTATSQVPVK